MQKLDLEQYKEKATELYKNGKTVQQIKEILNITADRTTINARLKEWGTPVSLYKVFPEQDIKDIISLYLDYWGLEKLATKYNTSRLTIRNLLIRHKVQLRDANYSPSNRKIVEFTDIQQGIIDGLMLGDGGLVKIPENSTRNTSLITTNIYKEFLEDIEQQLSNIKFGYSTTKAHTSVWNNKVFNHKQSYRLKSESLIYFKDLYRKWCTEENNYKKFIPEDLVINPYTLLYWYYGDGSYCKNIVKNKPYYSIALYTNNFSDSCLELLISKLTELGLPFRKQSNTPKGQKKQYCLKIARKEYVAKFFELLPDNTLDCFSYKFPDYKNKLENYAITY